MELTSQCSSVLIEALGCFADSTQLMRVSAWSYPLPPSPDCDSLRRDKTWA